MFMACDEYGALYTVALDGSYTEIGWEDIPWPASHWIKVIRTVDGWVAMDAWGVRIATFQTRQNARNFKRALASR